MTGQGRRRTFIVLAFVSLAALAMFLLLNIGGWRARILARLLRVDNPPVVVPPPSNFQPQVPPGFEVSIFATGFRISHKDNVDVIIVEGNAKRQVQMVRKNIARLSPAPPLTVAQYNHLSGRHGRSLALSL